MKVHAVNFYKRFIGDIQAKTGGLSLAEFGAYDRLLDHYYSTEQPVPADKVYRICRAMSAPERACVDAVLAEFFQLTPQGYIQSKADEVIAKALPLIEAARENGKKGGRPKRNPVGSAEKPSGFQKQNPAETEMVKPSQSQSQSHNSPSLRSGEVGADALPGVSTALFADYLEVRRAKKAGKFTPTAARGLMREAEKAGLPLVRAIEACCEYGWIGFNPKWYAERQARSPTEAGARPITTSERRAATIAGLTNPGNPKDEGLDDRTLDVHAVVVG